MFEAKKTKNIPSDNEKANRGSLYNNMFTAKAIKAIIAKTSVGAGSTMTKNEEQMIKEKHLSGFFTMYTKYAANKAQQKNPTIINILFSSELSLLMITIPLNVMAKVISTMALPNISFDSINFMFSLKIGF